jgi:NIMA (never in mitosis gene a)-related kinase
LGCVLYHISTLEPPFQGENLLLLGYNIINKVPKDLPSIYSEKLNKFILWLLVKNPFNRPKVSDVVETLNNFQTKPNPDFGNL